MSIRVFKSTAFSPISPNKVRTVGYEYHAFPLEHVGVLIDPCPKIASQSSDSTVNSGQDAFFSITGNSISAATFQWQVSVDAGDSWSNLAEGAPYAGVASQNLSISPTSGALSGHLYRCVVSMTGCDNVISIPALLTVLCQSITAQPSPQNVSSGDPASFSVTASLSGNTYHWQVSTNSGGSWGNLSNGAPYSGVLTNTLTIDPTDISQNGYLYRCVVSHSGCSDAISNSALLGVVITTITVEYLIVGGGGGGGRGYGGGGGGGEVKSGTIDLPIASSTSAVVGAGGAGGAAAPSYRGSAGADSSFGVTTSKGGGPGGGGGFPNPTASGPGGSGGPGGGGGGGGDGAGDTSAGGTGTPGGNGGHGFWDGANTVTAGGGASTASNGNNPVLPAKTQSGAGADGVSSSITGVAYKYGGGGGGGSAGVVSGCNPGGGGLDGGGNGRAADDPNVGFPGVANSGGGGGGSGSPSKNGGIGGSGVVIVSYAGAQIFTGGTVTSFGGSTIHKFTSNGTLAPI